MKRGKGNSCIIYRRKCGNKNLFESFIRILFIFFVTFSTINIKFHINFLMMVLCKSLSWQSFSLECLSTQITKHLTLSKKGDHNQIYHYAASCVDPAVVNKNYLAVIEARLIKYSSLFLLQVVHTLKICTIAYKLEVKFFYQLN